MSSGKGIKKPRFALMKIPRRTKSIDRLKDFLRFGQTKEKQQQQPLNTRRSLPTLAGQGNVFRRPNKNNSTEKSSNSSSRRRRARANAEGNTKTNPRTYGARPRTMTQTTTLPDDDDYLTAAPNPRTKQRSQPPQSQQVKKSNSADNPPKTIVPDRKIRIDLKQEPKKDSRKQKKPLLETDAKEQVLKKTPSPIAAQEDRKPKIEDNANKLGESIAAPGEKVEKKPSPQVYQKINKISQPMGSPGEKIGKKPSPQIYQKEAIPRKLEVKKEAANDDEKEALIWQLKGGDTVSIFQDDGKGINAKNFVRKVMSEQGLQSFIEAFNKLETYPALSPITAYTTNLMKNRYNDIPCLDHRRVVIRGTENDYIHANYVDSYKHSKAFICSQGPKESTVIDFWAMIWQENVRVLVMLTKTMETGKEKCYEYWPLKKDEVKKFGNFDIKSIYFEEQSNCTQTVMIVRNGNGEEIRTIVHLKFTAWPDYHIPENPLPFLQFLGHARKLQYLSTKKISSSPNFNPDSMPLLGPPIIVHCSAGVGRTGTFCAVDIGIRRLTDIKRIDMIETVRLLRTQRAFSIQKVDQFQFVNVCLVGVALHLLNETDKEKDIDEEVVLSNMQKSLRHVVQQNPNTNDN